MESSSFALSPVAIALWWATLVVTLLVFVPLAWRLLHRTWRAAAQIRDYTARTLEAGLGIAGNTEAVSELETTLATAGNLLDAAREVHDSSGRLRGVLVARVKEDRS